MASVCMCSSVCCECVCAPGSWLSAESVRRVSAPDGSADIMKFNLNSAVCLYLYVCVRLQSSLAWLFHHSLHTHTPFLSTKHLSRSRNPPFPPPPSESERFLDSSAFLETKSVWNSSSRCPSGDTMCTWMCPWVEFQAQTIYWFGWNVFVTHRALESNTQTQILYHVTVGESDRFRLDLISRLVWCVFDLLWPFPARSIFWLHVLQTCP